MRGRLPHKAITDACEHLGHWSEAKHDRNVKGNNVIWANLVFSTQRLLCTHSRVKIHTSSLRFFIHFTVLLKSSPAGNFVTASWQLPDSHLVADEGNIPVKLYTLCFSLSRSLEKEKKVFCELLEHGKKPWSCLSSHFWESPLGFNDPIHLTILYDHLSLIGTGCPVWPQLIEWKVASFMPNHPWQFVCLP